MARNPTLYHNMLVSTRVGGGEKVAIAIHKHVDAARPGSGELLVPAGGESERTVSAESLAYRPYDLERLTSRRRLASLVANGDLSLKLRGASRGILHVHSPFVYGALRPLRAVSKIRTILHLHLDYTAEQLQWALARAPDLVIVCAGFMERVVAETLRRGNHGRTRIAVAINAVDLARFAPGDKRKEREALGVAADRPVYLMAANLAPHKGQETAIRAVAHLKERGYRPLLWLVGEEREEAGAYKAKLHTLVRELGAGDVVEFLGFRNDMPRLLHAADCLLLPSVSEGLPLSILEAQASKVTVVAAPTAGIPEVVKHGETGFLIAADDANGYADVLESLANNAALAGRVSDAAYRQVVERCGLDRYCARILEEYDEMLSVDRAMEPAA